MGTVQPPANSFCHLLFPLYNYALDASKGTCERIEKNRQRQGKDSRRLIIQFLFNQTCLQILRLASGVRLG